MHFNKLIFIVFFFIAGCHQAKIVEKKDYIFGTIVEIKVFGENEEAAVHSIELVFEEFRRLHHYLHPWEKSILNEINESIRNGRNYRTEDNEIISIINHNIELESKTHGYFNPAIGKLIQSWGFHSDQFANTMPNLSHIQDLRKNLPHMSDISFYKNYWLVLFALIWLAINLAYFGNWKNHLRILSRFKDKSIKERFFYFIITCIYMFLTILLFSKVV